MQHEWILVRTRQAELLAEAERERLARLVREAADAERSEPSMRATAIVHPAASRLAGQRVMAVGAALAAEPTLKACDCPEG